LWRAAASKITACAVRGAATCTHLRQDVARHSRELGSGFLETRQSDLEIWIGLNRALDQRIKLWILK
jgi:hypothetical protein